MYEDEDIITDLIEFCRANTKLRDLQLYLTHKEHVYSILDAISHNYMLKTVILKCEQRIRLQSINKAKEIQKERIGFKIVLKVNERTVYPKVELPFSTNYPE